MVDFTANSNAPCPHCVSTMAFDTTPEILLLVLSAMHPGGNMSRNFKRRRNVIDFPGLNLKEKHSQRSMALLDALAAICIKEPRKQVAAVSLSLTIDGCILCIATNDGVPPEIPMHLKNVFFQLKKIRSSLRSPPQEGTDVTDTPRPDKGPDTDTLENSLLCDVFRFSMHKFKQRLIKRKRRFEAEVIPGMGAYASERRSGWTREEGKNYKKFEQLLSLFSLCFELVELPTPEDGAEQLAPLVNDMAFELREMIVDEGDMSQLARWEREIGWASCFLYPIKLTVSL